MSGALAVRAKATLWSNCLSIAANEAGYTGKFFTYYAGVSGTPTAMGASGAGRVYQVAYNYNNMGGEMDKLANEFKAKNQFKVDPQIAENQRAAKLSTQGSQAKQPEEKLQGDDALFKGKTGADFQRAWRNYVDSQM